MVTAEGVAWFLMSEGTLSLMIRRDKKAGIGFRMYPTLTIANTDLALLEATEAWFRKKGISHFRKKKTSSNKPCFAIVTQCISVKKAIDLLYPHLLGAKKTIANLLYDYFEKVWLQPDNPEKYKAASHERFLIGVKLHDAICAINIGKTRNRKYDITYFCKLWSMPAPNPKLGVT